MNYADGCCEPEQNRSSSTALEFGANESRKLRGDFLTAEFRERNHKLLNFDRTAELTSGKTPSGKVRRIGQWPCATWMCARLAYRRRIARLTPNACNDGASSLLDTNSR